MGLKTTQIGLECPPYGAKFVDNDTVLTAGGGGEGKNGIPNKLTLLKIDPSKKEKISVFTEYSLEDDEDCPMSLDVQNGIILTGVNINSKSDKNVPNTHLREFHIDKNNEIKFINSVDVHKGKDHSIYQKSTVLSKDGSQAAIVMSDLQSSLYIVNNIKDLTKYVSVKTSGEVKDIAISPDGTVLCYITKKGLHIVSMGTGKEVSSKELGFTLSKVEFYNDSILIVAGSSKQNTVVVSKFSIPKSNVIQQSVVDKSSKGVTSIDVNINNGIISLACSDCSIVLVKSSDLKSLKKLKNVHKFAITKITSNEQGSYLISVSADSTINFTEIPKNYVETKSLSPLLILISIILIALLSIGLQHAHNNGHIKALHEKSIEFYNLKTAESNNESVSIISSSASNHFSKHEIESAIELGIESAVNPEIEIEVEKTVETEVEKPIEIIEFYSDNETNFQSKTESEVKESVISEINIPTDQSSDSSSTESSESQIETDTIIVESK